MILGVDAGGVLKARIPGRIVKRILGLIDFEIYPLIIGGHLELIIVIHSLWLRIKEDFDYVAIPKQPSLYLRVLSLINI